MAKQGIRSLDQGKAGSARLLTSLGEKVACRPMRQVLIAVMGAFELGDALPSKR